MYDDPLDNEVSVGMTLTASTGIPIEIKGKAKSRALAAADRLLGNVLDFLNPWLEAAPAKKRAKTAAEVEVIKAANQNVMRGNNVNGEPLQRSKNEAAV